MSELFVFLVCFSACQFLFLHNENTFDVVVLLDFVHDCAFRGGVLFFCCCFERVLFFLLHLNFSTRRMSSLLFLLVCLLSNGLETSATAAFCTNKLRLFISSSLSLSPTCTHNTKKIIK